MVGAMLHVRCGDDILPALTQAGVPGERLCSQNDALRRERERVVAGR